jgi:hypothetical protein
MLVKLVMNVAPSAVENPDGGGARKKGFLIVLLLVYSGTPVAAEESYIFLSLLRGCLYVLCTA